MPHDAPMTTGQGSLLDNDLGPFQAHSDTSRAAAIANYPRTGTQRGRVLAAIAASEDGLTDEEITARTGIASSSERPRRVELVQAELVIDSGRRRPTSTGSLAVVWVANMYGRIAHALATVPA